MGRGYKQNVIVSLALLILLWWLLTGCKAKTIYVPVHSSTTVTETVRDTVVEVRLVPYKDSVSVRDTMSRIENVYAYSTALWRGGMLSHTLGMKEDAIKAEVQVVEVVRRDTVSVPFAVERIVEKNVLRRWQRVLIWLGVGFVVFIGIRLFSRF